MSKPNPKNHLPDFAGQSKIMFVNEGNPLAMLVTNKAGRRNIGHLQMATAEAALAWCRKNMTMLVYLPIRLEAN